MQNVTAHMQKFYGNIAVTQNIPEGLTKCFCSYANVLDSFKGLLDFKNLWSLCQCHYCTSQISMYYCPDQIRMYRRSHCFVNSQLPCMAKVFDRGKS